MISLWYEKDSDFYPLSFFFIIHYNLFFPGVFFFFIIANCFLFQHVREAGNSSYSPTWIPRIQWGNWMCSRTPCLNVKNI